MAHAGGRPTKLTRELIEHAEGYLEQIDPTSEIPTIEGFAIYLGTHKTTLYEWDKLDTPLGREFSNVFKDIQASQAQIVINGAIFGKLNPVISKLLLVKHDYIDRKDSDITSNGNDITFINDVPRPARAADANAS